MLTDLSSARSAGVLAIPDAVFGVQGLEGSADVILRMLARQKLVCTVSTAESPTLGAHFALRSVA